MSLTNIKTNASQLADDVNIMSFSGLKASEWTEVTKNGETLYKFGQGAQVLNGNLMAESNVYVKVKKPVDIKQGVQYKLQGECSVTYYVAGSGDFRQVGVSIVCETLASTPVSSGGDTK